MQQSEACWDVVAGVNEAVTVRRIGNPTYAKGTPKMDTNPRAAAYQLLMNEKAEFKIRLEALRDARGANDTDAFRYMRGDFYNRFAIESDRILKAIDWTNPDVDTESAAINADLEIRGVAALLLMELDAEHNLLVEHPLFN